jgi:hypothetical protein
LCAEGRLLRKKEVPLPISSYAKQLFSEMREAAYNPGMTKVKHARYFGLMLAESHLRRRLFGSMVRRITGLPSPTG